MRIDLRVKHDVETRRRAAELFDSGMGCRVASLALSVPRDTARQWRRTCRAFGSEVLPAMDGKQARYTFEQKVTAASAVVDGRATRAEAMAEFGIMSLSPLERWCRLYRAGAPASRSSRGAAEGWSVLVYTCVKRRNATVCACRTARRRERATAGRRNGPQKASRRARQ